jgi:hypothetical protein
LKDFVLELKDLNDIEISIPEFSNKNPLAEAKQYFLNQFELAFAKHLLEFKKAYALGKDFAKKVTDENNS